MKRHLKAAVAGCLIATSGGAAATLEDKAALALTSKAQCTSCHHLERKLVGPSFKEIAQKRKSDKDGAAILMKKVREGGAGVYGQIPMPPHPKTRIGDDDLKNLVDWILAR